MSESLETILRLSAAGDHNALLAYVQQDGQDTNQLVMAALQLLATNQFPSAYVVARAIASKSIAHPVAALALSIGGSMIGNPGDHQIGTDLLRRTVDLLEPEQQATIYSEIICKTVPNLVNHAFLNNNTEMMLQLLETLKAGVPSLRPIFDLQTPAAAFDLEQVRRRGRERATLIPMVQPPAGAPKAVHKAVVAVREYFLGAVTDPKKSRLCEIGPRIADAFTAYGWPSHFYGMRFLDVEEDYRGIAEMCRQTGADILVLDDNLIQNEIAKKARTELVAQMKREIPGLKVISTYFDPWMLSAEDIITASAMVDLIWTPSPSLPVWDHPALKDKACMTLYPLGVDFAPPIGSLKTRLTFAGSVMGNNWHRALWLGAIKHEGLPVDPQISSHKADGLSALESYKVYLSRLADAQCSLNFSMRNDLQRIFTSRTIETILSGALLIEEWSPDIGHYFVAGDHYLDFITFGELRSVAQFIESHPDTANAIRKAGADFARERYNDMRIVANIEARLYHPEIRSETPAMSASPATPQAGAAAPSNRFFGSMVGVDVRVKVVDIGANPINGPAPYEALLKSNCAEVVGFEPNLEALAELEKIKGPNEIYLPHAIGDGKRHTLNFCQAPGMTSLLTPNPKVLGLFHGFPDWGRIVATEQIDTVRLDDIPETSNVDFLKMDIQGAELMVLRNAENRLRDALVVQTEVEFMEMYVDQPLFSDIDLFMRERGFVFHRFFPTVSRVIRPLMVDNSIYAGLSQLLWADAVFVRDFTKLELMTDRQLVSAAAILHECFQSIDLALHLLNEYDRRQGSQMAVNYLIALRKP